MNVIVPAVLCTVFAAGLMRGAEEGSFQKTLTVSGAVDLDVKTDSGAIVIRQGSSETVSVHAILKADHGWFGSGDVEARMHELESHPPVEQNGNRVRVGYVREELLRNISMRLEIETPADTQVRARADSGGIRVNGIHGAVDCEADSGGIEIEDVSGNVHVAADSGGIHARNINGSFTAKVDSGGIEALGIAGSIDAHADSGSMKLEQTTPARIHASVESGGVRLTLARGAGYNLSADADSGHVSVPTMTVQSAFSSHRVEGKVGSGGPMVSVKADSGSITIE